MCGRAAQSVGSVSVSATSLGITPSLGHIDGANGTCNNNRDQGSSMTEDPSDQWRDNYNLSPGMDAMVFVKDDITGSLEMKRMIWGLVTKPGTERNPLPPGGKDRMALHFSNLMYNARTDTLFAKPTFSRLAAMGRSCVVALDGYFEWKASPLAGGRGRKQPYFVYRKQRANKLTTNNEDETNGGDGVEQELQSCLLLAGLWTRVKTGIKEEPFLDTFTVLTTEACSSIQWLHHRMPVCIWDTDLARRWLDQPTQVLHEKLDQDAREAESFAWHAVTTEMSSVKFREKTAIKAIPRPRSVTSYFNKSAECASTSTKTKESHNSHDQQRPSQLLPNHINSTSPDADASRERNRKRHNPHPLALQGGSKKTKKSPETKGTITSFFSPKKQK